jgi:fermentation-respiration switch protein FrsA (DUF1100 family)
MWRDVTFASKGDRCSGWLYVPENLPSHVKAPTIVMANAITAVKEMVLPAYAERFVAAGYVCLAFDFRFLGASGGNPRGQISASEQIDDLRNAISWLSLQPEVDPNRIGAWGASFGGAHVLYLAAFDRRIKAVVATVPSMRASDTMVHFVGRQGLMQVEGFLGWERTNSYQGGAATFMKAVSDGSENALLPNPEAYGFYTRLASTVAPRWSNQVTTESLEKLIEYDPAYPIEQISPTPLLVIEGENDQSQPPHAVRQAFERAGEPKKLMTVACGHTDLLGKAEYVDQAASAAIEWFKRYLG